MGYDTIGLYKKTVIGHYRDVWDNVPSHHNWNKGPIQNLRNDFEVLEFAPNTNRRMWTYATCGMSTIENEKPLEVHMFSSKQDFGIVELLTALAYYHQGTAKIGLHHTVNFGRPWQDASICEYGYISLPYLDGPDLEKLIIGNKIINFYWLIPITIAEVQYKTKYGAESLESKFESVAFDFLDNDRSSLV